MASDAAQNPAHYTPENAITDPDLASLIEAWSTLPEPIKAGILAMVQAAK